MKRCPHCYRNYYDDGLRYCLDDGSALVDGPGSDVEMTLLLPNEQATRTLHEDKSPTASEPASSKATSWKMVAFPAGGILVLLIGYFVYHSISISDNDSRSIRSLAVLPLENLSGVADQEFISDGITESIITNLSRIGSLRITSRTSAMKFKNSGKTIPEIAKELGVDGIIEGSVLRSADNLRINVQLIHGASDSPVWTQRYERKLSDILKLESEIAQAVASEIKVKLTPEEEKRINNQRTIDPRAVEAALLGKHYFRKFTADGTKKAVEEFQKAVNIEPGYADAWGGLADAWTASAMNGNMRMAEARLPTQNAAIKALEAEPGNPAGHIALCFYKNNYEFDWVGGEQHCKRGIELAPQNGKAHFAYAFLLARIERWDDMSARMEEAMRVDPDEAWWPSVYGYFLVQAGRLDGVPQLLDRARKISDRWGSYAQLYRAQGKYEDALRVATEEKDDLSIARAYALMGNRQKAEEYLKKVNPTDVFAPILIYAALGEKEKAFEMLNKNLDNNEGFMGVNAEFMELNKLRSDPRWNELLRRMNRV